jgi:uncharacterized membrane protein/predicted DsbA family dithiol-disulfide isomerase
MRATRVFTIGAIAATIVGLGASIASMVDDFGSAATFCAETGCETVRSSAWAHPLGIPMSVLGVGFYGAMVVLAFANRPRWRMWLAIAGGAWALWLIALQAFVIGAWCKLCLVADPSAIVLAVCVVGGARPLRLAWSRVGVLAPALAAVVVGLAMWTRPPSEPPLPPVAVVSGPPVFVTQAQVPGAVTIVEVVDFECPFCREMQRRLDAALVQTKVPVKVVRKMLPLQMHRHALPAALAWCCADAQGKGDDMARALFAAPASELTDEGCEKIAERVGCDVERYRRDVPAAKARVMADVTDVRAAQIHKLPTLFIGNTRVTGASMTAEQLTSAIEQAATKM